MTLVHEHDHLDATTIGAWRMAIGAVILCGYAAVTRRSLAVLTTLRTRPVAAVVVGSGTAAYQVLFFGAVLLVGVSVATVISLGVAPLLAAAWEHARAATRPSLREVAVLVGALSGLLLISLAAGHGTGLPADRPGRGLLLAFASGATYAATTVLGRSLAQRVDAIALTTSATVAGAVVLAPFAVVPALTQHTLPKGDAASVALLLYLGLVPLALAYVLLYAGLRTTSGSTATVATLVEPLTAAVLAALLLGERLAWPGVLGGALILAAVAALRPQGEPVAHA